MATITVKVEKTYTLVLNKEELQIIQQSLHSARQHADLSHQASALATFIADSVRNAE